MVRKRPLLFCAVQSQWGPFRVLGWLMPDDTHAEALLIVLLLAGYMVFMEVMSFVVKWRFGGLLRDH